MLKIHIYDGCDGGDGDDDHDNDDNEDGWMEDDKLMMIMVRMMLTMIMTH